MMKSKPKLTETTLKIYTYMVLKRGWIGVRELQRELKISSPGLVSYHLTKLLEAGLVERSQDGKYRAKPGAGAEILKGFIRLGRLIIPRYAFYASFLTTLTCSYIYLLLREGLTPAGLLGIFITLLASAITVYETIRMIREVEK